MSTASASAATATSKFHETLTIFCAELRATFPELAGATVRAVSAVTPATFWRSWQANLSLLASRDSAALFSERRGILVPPIVLTPTLWGEVSEATQDAIWRFLRTLLLEAMMEGHIDETTLTEERSRIVMAILTEERLEAATTAMDTSEGAAAVEEATAEIFGSMSGLMDRLRGLLGAAAADGSGGAAAGGAGVSYPPMLEIPERLRNGKIARLAQEMAKQFKPEEFGIDASILASAGDNVEEVLRRLAEIYQRDPTMLIAGAKRMAERIQRQVMGGSLKQEELVAEAKEFVELFKEHPLFKEAIEKFNGMVGEGGLMELFGGGGAASAPSDRLRTVQDRLRKKLAARQAKK